VQVLSDLHNPLFPLGCGYPEAAAVLRAVPVQDPAGEEQLPSRPLLRLPPPQVRLRLRGGGRGRRRRPATPLRLQLLRHLGVELRVGPVHGVGAVRRLRRLLVLHRLAVQLSDCQLRPQLAAAPGKKKRIILANLDFFSFAKMSQTSSLFCQTKNEKVSVIFLLANMTNSYPFHPAQFLQLQVM